MSLSTSNSSSVHKEKSTHTTNTKLLKPKPRSLADKSLSTFDDRLSEPIKRLKLLYKRNILPLEELYKFSSFGNEPLADIDFEAKPIVLCVGQYSTGKTSFIKYLLERDFPGLRIGPEPTTDRFVAVMHGETEKIIPGNAVTAHKNKPFSTLKQFGISFLNKFECAELNSPILQKINFIDTPGVLAGSEQTKERLYTFPEVITWFADRANRILLFFDANKLDISDEMKKTINALKGNDDKIRVILNKADSITGQQLMRVYGALMWSLGKVIKTPEVPRIYIGSFWGQTYKNLENEALFNAEEADLLADLRSIPRNSTVRNINELVKRVKKLRIHCLVLSHLRDQIGIFGKSKKQKKLLTSLNTTYKQVQSVHNLPLSDFPPIIEYRKILGTIDLSKFKSLHKNSLKDLDRVLSEMIPDILSSLPSFEQNQSAEDSINSSGEAVLGAWHNPFDDANENDRDEMINCDENLAKQSHWVISGPVKSKYDNMFDKINVTGNKISGKKAKELMFRSKLPLNELRRIWELSDIDKDLALDRDEFALCMYLVDLFKNGEMKNLMREGLPVEFIPPSKRDTEN